MPVLAGLISLALSVCSCAKFFPARSPIPDNASTMEQIYNQHSARHGFGGQSQHQIPQGHFSLEGYTREVFNELSVRFPRLPNPTIIMYVFPHLSLENTPIPGYSTMFQLYEKTEYSLPGEVNTQ